MSDKPAPAAPVNTDSAILNTLQAIAATMQGIDSRLRILETSPTQQPMQQQQQQQQQPQQFQQPQVLAGPTRWFIRIKPYNKQIGHLRRNQYFQELGRVLHGGTGAPGDIPEWAEVPEAVALSMTKYRQREGNLNTPQTLDIVTEAEMMRIDQMEQTQRMATLGISGLSPSQVLAQAASTARAAARTIATPVPQTPPPIEAPSILAGAVQYQQYQQALQPMQPMQPMQPQPQPQFSGVPLPPTPPMAGLAPVESLPAHMAGRAAALANVPVAPAAPVPQPVDPMPQVVMTPDPALPQAPPPAAAPVAAPAPMPMPMAAPIPGRAPAAADPVEQDANAMEDFAAEAEDMETTDPDLTAGMARAKNDKKGKVTIRRGKR